jgi:hypothetical protein
LGIHVRIQGSSMNAFKSWTAVLFALSGWTVGASGQTPSLQSPEVFDSVKDTRERSRALFVEAGKAILSPRCMNCHPKGDSPTQGDDMHPHVPRIVRGMDGHGPTALACTTCHQAANFDPANVPGNPQWHLAPAAMAWQGLSLGQICRQMTDVKRNGGKTLAQIQEHMASDPLVGWGWAPGGNRAPAPGTQAQLGALMKAWVATGAVCPA